MGNKVFDVHGATVIWLGLDGE